jgi:hypothetical protein
MGCGGAWLLAMEWGVAKQTTTQDEGARTLL